ncbi:unnamed protein product, partial [Iphiclides podalirius]
MPLVFIVVKNLSVPAASIDKRVRMRTITSICAKRKVAPAVETGRWNRNNGRDLLHRRNAATKGGTTPSAADPPPPPPSA